MTYYERLGVSEVASRDEIKLAFRTKALQTHPDLRKGSPADIGRASQDFARLSEAYSTLIDPEKRAKYDETLRPASISSPANNGRRITPPMQTFNAHVQEDLKEMNDLRREIWEEPREVLVRGLILYLVFLIVLPFGVYAVIQDTGSTRAAWSFIVLHCALGLWVAYSAWLRLLRIRASSGVVRFWKTSRGRRRRSRYSTAPLVERWLLALSLLVLLAVLLFVVFVSGMLIVDFGNVELSFAPARSQR